MSDDLISRKVLLGTERLLMTDIVENNPTAKYILEQVLFDIENAPTVFDKEKVIEELVELRQKEYCDDDDETSIDGEEIYDRGRSQGRFEAYHNAMKIVEKGGVE